MKRLIYSTMFLLFIGTFTNQVVAQSTWKAPADADKLENPYAGNEKAAAKGKKLYKQLCAICHGVKGKGDGMAGASLTPKPANFTKDVIKGETDGALFWKMSEGNAPMAAYKESLSEDERWVLITYIRTLQK